MRWQGQYGDPSANTYVGAQVETNSGSFEGRLEAFIPERENPPYPNSKPKGPWRWEMDASNISNSMTSRMFNEGRGGDASSSRPYFQGQRPDPKLALQNQSSNDGSFQAHEDMNVGYEGYLSQTFEGLEQKFQDEIIKLAKEHNDAKDSENARHKEKIKAINAQYEEKLAELGARHASCRDEFLQRESHARQQYQQTMLYHLYVLSFL